MPASQPSNFNLQEFTDVGQLLVGGRLYTYAYGTTAQKIAYTDPDGAVPHTYTADGAGGQYIALNARGELPAPLYLGDGSYDIALKRPDGSTVWTRKADGVENSIKAWIASVAGSLGSSLIGFIHSVAGSVKRTLQDKERDELNSRDIGTKSDGVTDDTGSLLDFFTNNPAYRGKLVIPYGTKFNRDTVYAAIPVGCIVWDESSINQGQPPGYKSKVVQLVTNDLVADDTQFGTVSSHHPAFRQNNTGKAGTSSATGFYHSYLRAAGYRWNGDPIDGMQLLTSKSQRGNLWRTADVLNTAYLYASQGAKQWTAGENVAAGSIRNTSGGSVYQTTAGGVCGNAVPVGNGNNISDGMVLWNYLGPWNAGHTVFYYDEDGYGALIGFTTARFGVETSNSRGLSMNVNEVTGDTWLRDEQRAQDILVRSTGNGIQLGGLPSWGWGGLINGVTLALSASLHIVNNAAATTVTGITMPAGQLRCVAYLMFPNANTTFAKANFNFIGAADMVVPQFGVVMVIKEPNGSGNPYLVPLNF